MLVLGAAACGSSYLSTTATSRFGTSSPATTVAPPSLRAPPSGGPAVRRRGVANQAAGHSHAAPLSIEWSNFIGGPQVVQALEANAIDLGALGDVPLAYTQVADKGIVAVAALKTAGATSGIVSAPGSRSSPVWPT